MVFILEIDEFGDTSKSTTNDLIGKKLNNFFFFVCEQIKRMKLDAL